MSTDENWYQKKLKRHLLIQIQHEVLKIPGVYWQMKLQNQLAANQNDD